MKVGKMSEESGGLDRLSPEELIAMIKEIAAGTGEHLVPEPDGPANAYWPEDYYESKPSLSDIQTLIAREQHEIDAQLRSGAPVFVITDRAALGGFTCPPAITSGTPSTATKPGASFSRTTTPSGRPTWAWSTGCPTFLRGPRLRH
jgi:hypothetical protein